LLHTHQALLLLQNEAHLADWQDVLYRLADNPQMHGLISGRGCRILLDRNVFSPEEAATRLGLALSTALEPVRAANWIEGFLKDSGALLVHDPALFALLDQWLASLPGRVFVELLPLLRRTFAGFTQPERRMIGERARRGAAGETGGRVASSFDPQRAAAVLPRLAQLLGAVSPGDPAGDPAGSPVEDQPASTRGTL
jgi:hypothetical protein